MCLAFGRKAKSLSLFPGPSPGHITTLKLAKLNLACDLKEYDE